MTEPLFSIIVPVYNTEEYLDDCINSVISQNYIRWELLLVDDGSSDSSGSILDRYQNLYKEKIRVFHKKNEGQFLSRQLGIKYAIGDYILFLDSDDMLEKNALETLRDEVANDSSIELFMYDAYHLSAENIKTVGLDKIDVYCHLKIHREIIKECFLKRTSRISMCSYCIKNSIIKSIDFKPVLSSKIKSQEDFMMIYEIVKKIINLKIIGAQLYIYRDNPNSITHKMDANMFYDGVSVSTIIYKEIISDFSFDIKHDFDSYIIHRLSWLPISFLVRASREFCIKDIKKSWKKVKTNFLFVNFTKHMRIKAKSYRLFLFFIKLHCFNFARIIALHFLH